MNSIQNSTLLESLNVGQRSREQEATGARREMGQEDFLRLMVAQMKNQDPTKPLDPNEYLSQLTQFTNLQGIQDLNQTVSGLAQPLQSIQTLQASSLVGRSVIVEGNQAYLPEQGTVRGSVPVPGLVEDLSVGVYNSSGQLLRQIPLGNRGTGDVAFTWDGRDANGVQLPADVYTLRPQGRVAGELQGFGLELQAQVQSVSLNAGGADMTLNLTGLGNRSIDDIKEIF